jgi:hypothetical protein
MLTFPEAPKKMPIPAFAAYPVGYDLIRAHLEPHIPAEEFAFGFYGLDARLAKSRDFSPITIFRLQYLPNKWRRSHWSLYAYGALRKDKAAIRDAMVGAGFRSLIEFLERPRDPIWRDLAFSRSLVWNSGTLILSSEDHSQIEGKKPNQPLEPTAPSGRGSS